MSVFAFHWPHVCDGTGGVLRLGGRRRRAGAPLFGCRLSSAHCSTCSALLCCDHFPEPGVSSLPFFQKDLLDLAGVGEEWLLLLGVCQGSWGPWRLHFKVREAFGELCPLGSVRQSQELRVTWCIGIRLFFEINGMKERSSGQLGHPKAEFLCRPRRSEPLAFLFGDWQAQPLAG